MKAKKNTVNKKEISHNWEDLKVYNKMHDSLDPLVSIKKYGVVALNNSAMKLTKGSNFAGVSYSKFNNALVFSFSSTKTEYNCIKITIKKMAGSISLSCVYKTFNLNPADFQGKYELCFTKIGPNKFAYVVWLGEKEKELELL